MLKTTKLKVLILEDSLQDKELIIELLIKAGFQLDVTHAEVESMFTEALKKCRFDIIISDFKLPGFDAFGALELCQKICPEVPFICVSGSIGEEKAIELLKKGAVDYVLKDRPDRLPHAVQRALDEAKEKAALLKAEHELTESDARFRQVAETAQEWIWEVDMEGIYTYSSPMIETLLGYTPNELVGKKYFYDFFVPEEKEKLKNTAFEVFSKKEVFRNYENTNIHKNGQRLILSTNGSPIFDDNGNLKGYRGVDEDITERKQTEQALQKSENRFRKIIETSPDGIAITALDGTIQFVTAKIVSMWGYGSEDELLGRNTMEFLHPDYHEKAIYLINEMFNGNLTGVGEYLMVRKDGSTFYCEANANILRDASNIPTGILYVERDITERKQAEERLKLLNRAVEASSVSVSITDVDGNIIYTNPGFTKISGYPAEEVLGKNSRLLKSGLQPISYYKDLWDTILSGNDWLGEFQNKKKTGELYWEEAVISPIQNNKGEITHFVGVKNDITEQKRIAEARELLLEISQLMQEQIPLTVFLEKIHYELRKIVRAENFYVALYNEKEDNFTFPYHVDEYDKIELNKAYNLKNGFTDFVIKTNKTQNITPDFKVEIEKDGKYKSIGEETSVWLGVPYGIVSDSRAKGVIAIQDYKNHQPYSQVDQTVMEIIAGAIGNFIERKQFIQDLVEAKEKAEESDRLKSAFLANMSHEIRTPMNGILGFTDLLLNPDLDNEKKESYVKIVHQSGQRMLNTVNDIVEISKIEAGIVNVNIKETDLNSRVNELIRFFRPEAEKKGLKLILEILLPIEEKVFLTDQNKLDSILTNLIKNAIKFTESGTINVGCKKKGPVVEFYIKDTGIGIPAHRQDAVFNRFEQADIADSRAFQGSGLGLAIAKLYVEMLNGKMWLESEEGKGSTFYFTLPANGNLEEKSNDENDISFQNEKAKTKVKNLKILIAEDDETSRNYISLIVNDFGSVILEAKTGIEAIEL